MQAGAATVAVDREVAGEVDVAADVDVKVDVVDGGSTELDGSSTEGCVDAADGRGWAVVHEIAQHSTIAEAATRSTRPLAGGVETNGVISVRRRRCADRLHHTAELKAHHQTPGDGRWPRA